VNKWIQLLEKAESAEPPSGATAKTAKTPATNGPTPLLSVLSVPGEGPSANSRADLDAVAWTDADIERFKHYRHVATKAGFGKNAAEEIAERLVIRDREQDDRRACLECAELRASGRCAAAGGFHWASPQLEPVREVLQRCEGFKPNDRSAK